MTAPTSTDLDAFFAPDVKAWGYLPNLARAFSARTTVYAAWRQLNGAIKAVLSPRRYELATLGAALELRSSYCSLAHGRTLVADHLSEEEVIAVAGGDLSALADEDAAIVTFARQVVRDAPGITVGDTEPLRAAGLDDDDIFDVILAASARGFFSSVLDASCTQPDAAFQDLPARLRDALTVGRPIEAVGTQPVPMPAS